MSIDNLLKLIIAHDPETTAREIAEAIWLTLAIDRARISEIDANEQSLTSLPERTKVSLPSSVPQVDQRSPSPKEEQTRPTPAINEPGLSSSISTSEHGRADLYPIGANSNEEMRARVTPLRIPSVSALPNAAIIARSLRPLRRRVPSRHRIQLDEKATAERSAEENILVPVMRPAQSRWLAVHLVVDHGGAVMVWRDTIDELHRLLIRLGAFRDVRIWHFDSDTKDRELRLFPGLTSDIPRRANELSDPEGRNLILVVSDCVGRGWHEGLTTTALSLWSSSGPMVLFQLMPPQLWDRTALGREVEVRLKTSVAGIPNSRLLAVPANELDGELPVRSVYAPVVTLTPESIKTWVGVLTGLPESVVSGYAFDQAINAFASNRSADSAFSADQRVQRFLSLSTPTAQRLALLASAAPVTLPILNLLCATFLPKADQSQVAEVLLGGLVYRTSSAGIRDPDAVLYDFYDGVREQLLELAPFNQSSEVVASVSVYLEERAEREREMRVLLALPSDFDIYNLAETKPFAYIRATLLRKLGYSHLAEVIEQVNVSGTAQVSSSYENDNIQRTGRDVLVDSPDPEEQADIQTTINALVQSELPPSVTSTTQINTGNIGVAMAGNIYLYGQRGKTNAELLHGYLQRLTKRCGVLPLQGVREQKADDVLAISLDQVYTQLATTIVTDREMLNVEQLQHFSSAEYWEQHVGDGLLPLVKREALLIPKGILGDSDVYNTKGHRGVHNGGQLYDLEQMTLEDLESLTRKIIATNTSSVFAISFAGTRLVTESVALSKHLVLLGEPGSGKSTALRYIALTLAEASLDDHLNLAERLEGWGSLGEQGKLLPIFMPLLPLAKRLANEPDKVGSDEDVWNEIARHVEMNGAYPGLGAAVHDELEAGRVLLMLDGLDEVTGSDSRRQVVRAVHDFAEQHVNCRIVVACRVRAYEGEQNTEWQLPGWPTATLADWTVGQMHYFIDAWYGEAAKASAMPDTKRDDRIAKLKRAISNRDDLKKLGVRPLLLTIMALVHLNDGRLPEDRVSFCSRCIDILLDQWEVAGKDETVYGSLMDYINLPNMNIKALRPLFAKVAFVAHEAGNADSPERIGRATLREMVQDELEGLKHPNPYAGAKLFLEYTDVHAGLLQASDAGDAYAFPHQTFQEYLAGLELMSGVGFVERIMQRRNDDRWRIPIFLGIGHAVSEGLLAAPYQLLNRLFKMRGRDKPQHHADLLLAAELAADVGWDALERGGKEFAALRGELARALAEVVEGTALPAKDRVRAGVLLGELGDPRPGVCDLNIQMVAFPAAIFLLGEPAGRTQLDDRKNDTLVRIPTFALARYLVTNAQFAMFIADDGYNPERNWWDDAGRVWLVRDDQNTKGLQSWQQRKHKNSPRYWLDSRFGKVRSNHPVVGVSWYEASAFCHWLMQRQNDGYLYRLPSEAEWEYAARGLERRTYPWGEHKPDEQHANYEKTYNGTTAVGCFAAGMTPTGLQDLVGNVWEWTASVYGDYAKGLANLWQVPADVPNKRFVLRGRGWGNQPISLRASYRHNLPPDPRSFSVGFRLARHLPAD